MSFYPNLQKTASRLLKQYGKSVTIQVFSGGTYDPVTKSLAKGYTPTTGNGVFLNVDKSDVDGSQILTTDTKLIIENIDTLPTIDSTVENGGETLKVVSVSPLKPADTNLIYTLILRK
jgi:hypothetical protein